MALIRPIILANGSIPTPGGQGTVELFNVTPADFAMAAPWRIKGAYLWHYQEGKDGAQNVAGTDTWLYSDTCHNHIPGSANPIDAAAIVQINKLLPHNPFNGQNFSAFARVDFGDDWVIANNLWLFAQPQAGSIAYVYAQIYVYAPS